MKTFFQYFGRKFFSWNIVRDVCNFNILHIGCFNYRRDICNLITIDLYYYIMYYNETNGDGLMTKDFDNIFIAYKGRDLDISDIYYTLLGGDLEVGKKTRFASEIADDGDNVIFACTDEVYFLQNNNQLAAIYKKKNNSDDLNKDFALTISKNASVLFDCNTDDDLFSVLKKDYSFCGAFYNSDQGLLCCGNLNFEEPIWYAYTEKNHELVFSNHKLPLLCLCGDTIKEMGMNTLVFNGETCTMDNVGDYEGGILSYLKENNRGANEIKKVEYIPVHLAKNDEKYVYLTDVDYKFDPAIGRDSEVRSLEKKLLIPKKGVVLVGKEGVGKTAIVEGLAYRVRNGLVCDILKDIGILSIEVGNLIAGCKYRGDMEQRIENLCNELIKSNKKVVLFLDEIHNTVGTGTSDESSLDIANVLKPYISRDLIKVIGCTTIDEFSILSEDKAFRRRFNVVEVNELEKKFVKDILKNNIYNNMFNINVDMTDREMDKILDLIIKLSSRKLKFTYQTNANPDASINILMDCLAYMVVSNIKVATIHNFIEGIQENDSLNLTDIDKKILFDNFDIGNNTEIKCKTIVLRK